ncbi:MAG: hypothetical protein CL470_01995 [Acidimicrobiaceae bacterium]|nr:hypothetical protein [Acidimicrobiaceae bacterium]
MNILALFFLPSGSLGASNSVDRIESMSQLGDSVVNENTKTARPLDVSWRYTEFWPRAKRKARSLSFTKMLILPVVFSVMAILAIMLIIWAIDILV